MTGKLPNPAFSSSDIGGYNYEGGPPVLSVNGYGGDVELDATNINDPVSCEGTIARSIAAIFADSISVKRYGAKGDGSTDDTAAILAADTAASAAGVSLFFPPGNYMVNTTGIAKGVCSWIGCGKFASVIKSMTQNYPNNGAFLVSIESHNSFEFRDLGFDLTNATIDPGTGNPGHIIYALALTNCNNWTIKNCSFTGLQSHTIGVAVNAALNFVVNGCAFNQPVPSNSFNQAINISVASGPASNYEITDNICNGTGILSAGCLGTIARNFVNGTGFGAGIAVGPLAGCVFHKITDNICINGWGQDVNGTWPSGIESWTPYSIISGNICYNNSGHGIAQCGQASVVDGNFCLNNSQSGSNCNGITMASIPGYAGTECIISNNICQDNQVVKTQPYGYAEYVYAGGSAIINNSLDNNNFNNNKIGTMLLASTQFSFRGPQLFQAFTIAPGTIAVGAQYTTSFSITGAALGDTVKIAYGADQAQCHFFGYVTNAGTVRVVVQNNGSSSQTLASSILNVWVEKPAGYASLN